MGCFSFCKLYILLFTYEAFPLTYAPTITRLPKEPATTTVDRFHADRFLPLTYEEALLIVLIRIELCYLKTEFWMKRLLVLDK